jgi:hypothetical protein
MPNWIKTAGIGGAILLGLALVAGLGSMVFFPEFSNELATDNKWGGIFVILALIITLLKQVIGFIGFLTAIIKIGVILLFVALFLGVGLLILRTWKSSQTSNE